MQEGDVIVLQVFLSLLFLEKRHSSNFELYIILMTRLIQNFNSYQYFTVTILYLIYYIFLLNLKSDHLEPYSLN